MFKITIVSLFPLSGGSYADTRLHLNKKSLNLSELAIWPTSIKWTNHHPWLREQNKTQKSRQKLQVLCFLLYKVLKISFPKLKNSWLWWAVTNSMSLNSISTVTKSLVQVEEDGQMNLVLANNSRVQSICKVKRNY